MKLCYYISDTIVLFVDSLISNKSNSIYELFEISLTNLMIVSILYYLNNYDPGRDELIHAYAENLSC